jgi:hypothetical protein
MYAHCTQFCCIVSFHRLHDKRLPGALKHIHNTLNITLNTLSANSNFCMPTLLTVRVLSTRFSTRLSISLPRSFLKPRILSPFLVQIKPNHFCALPCTTLSVPDRNILGVLRHCHPRIFWHAHVAHHQILQFSTKTINLQLWAASPLHEESRLLRCGATQEKSNTGN